ncbi:MAG: acetyl-CoA carboxylase biotin carboxyl carrier protein subunit [Oscillospiraceae bacterium]|nr:acetyl-CoA carboxylase biotin carboxyl carrier protein subunit [Oscillospiraceae bacterium]
MKRFQVTVNGIAYDVQVQELDGQATAPTQAPVAAAPAPAPVAAAPVATAPTPVVPIPAAPAPAAPASSSTGDVRVTAPMPGNIWDVRCSIGQAVSKGDALIILEAMKMENEILAPQDGTVAGIHVSKGETVETGALLVSLS